ncbi:MAG: NADPH-dependent F420 reductase [Anaerolineales bacterium]|nr:MAG: NADPH-dependent F420 reductase [Anaerolineales bacterium]
MILTLAVIGGTGKLGPGLAKRWARAGYRVLIGSREAEKAERIAAEINEELSMEGVAGFQNAEAAKQADIVVFTVNYTAHEAVVASLKDVVKDKIVIDTTARIDFTAPAPPESPSAASMAQKAFGPSTQVVAAFQTVPAYRLKGEANEPLDLDVLVCSDSLPAAEEVIKLARAAGMRGYYAGGLENAIVIEGLTSILISMNKHYGSKTAAIAVRGLAV